MLFPLLRLCCVQLSLVGLVHAQDLSVPSSWRKPSNSRPLSERITISQNAIDAILPQLGSGTGEFNGLGYWQSGNAWSAAANHDEYANQTTFQSSVVANLQNAFSLWLDYDKFGSEYFMKYNDDALWWAQASLYSYRVYGDTTLLAHAEATWDNIAPFALTAASASAGSIPGKTFTIEPTCDGITMAGGVFWRPTPDDQSINSITTGLYMTLSATLAEITKDVKYTNAAIASANWIKSLNINGNNIVLDTINGHDCTRSASDWLFTYNSGKFIEGLSVLADVTGDSQWRTLMINIVAAAVKSGAWQGSDGIITEGVSTTSDNDGVGFKAVFIRGLNEAYTRNPSNQDLRTLIHSYINVQASQSENFAANGSTYSSNWHGPPQAFTAWGQLAALDVMVSAISAN
ncbi:Mannan endo-1,6-alpha-mannosidase DCW1 [Termitomyces sp. J132]|nr:Mannan endo-1,6-alpha-mannosidase DCW1 [Termitomyces sp. J132]